MTPGVSVDSNNQPYPDPLTLNLNKFVYTEELKPHTITQVEIDRFDLFLYDEYGNCYYGDIILLLNKKGSIHEFLPGDTIYLPAKEDIDKFYVKNRTS